MLRTPARFKLLATLLLTTASCTQEAAQIDLKGHNTYSRDGASYASVSPASGGYNNRSTSSYQPAPVYRNVSTSTQSSAKVQSIGVSDLSPPSGAGHSSASSPVGKPAWSSSNNTGTVTQSPFKPASTELKKADTAGSPIGNDTINPWTRKPRANASEALDESFNIRPQAKSANVRKEQMVSEVKIITKAEQEKAAQLDSIVGNDVEKVAKADAPAAKAVKTAVASSGSAFMWPVNSKKIISGYGPKGSGKVNDGINIASADGEPIWAAADGEVVYVGNELQGYGNMVLIKHGSNKTTTYAHLSRANVDKYDRVKQGEIIGYVGTTGNVKQPQLHFAIRDGKNPIDPVKQLNRNVASIR